jgi:hypothetical protein
MKKFLIILFLTITIAGFGQEPFDKYTTAVVAQDKTYVAAYQKAFTETSTEFVVLYATTIIPVEAIFSGAVSASRYIEITLGLTKSSEKVLSFMVNRKPLYLFVGNSNTGLIHILERHSPFIMLGKNIKRGKGALSWKPLKKLLDNMELFLKEGAPEVISTTTKGKITLEGTIDGVKYQMKINPRNRSITSFYKVWRTKL